MVSLLKGQLRPLEVDELEPLRAEEQLDLSLGTMSMLGHIDIGDVMPAVGIVVPLPIQEQNDVGILFQRA